MSVLILKIHAWIFKNDVFWYQTEQNRTVNLYAFCKRCIYFCYLKQPRKGSKVRIYPDFFKITPVEGDTNLQINKVGINNPERNIREIKKYAKGSHVYGHPLVMEIIDFGHRDTITLRVYEIFCQA